MRALAVPLALALFAAACATGRSSSSALPGGAAGMTPSAAPAGEASYDVTRATRSARTMATLREIPTSTLDRDPGVSLHDVVRRYWGPMLRPVLTARGAAAQPGDNIGVYMGTLHIGGLEELQTFRAGSVASLRRMSTTEAFAKFGRMHPGGAIVLTLR